MTENMFETGENGDQRSKSANRPGKMVTVVQYWFNGWLVLVPTPT